MVGVPRSKGCRICVTRRVRCDQTRPTCNNCKKGNRPCPGYGQDLKFQDEGAKLRKRFEFPEPESTPNPFSIDSFGDTPPDLITGSDESTPASDDFQQPSMTPEIWDILGLDMQKTQRKTFLGLLEGKREIYLQYDESDSDKQDPLSIAEPGLGTAGEEFFFQNFEMPYMKLNLDMFSPDLNQLQLLSAFKSSLFPEQPSLNLPPAMRSHGRWLSHLPPLTGTNHLLDTAVRAVTLVHIGRVRNSEIFVNESRPYYGKALRLLNIALMDPVQGMTNETLSATILLSFYEMFASNSNDSWVRHAGGAGALMKMRGPARHRSGFDREIFLAYRYTLIVESFQHDVPCFLDEPEWRQLSKNIHTDILNSGISNERLEIFNVAEEFYSVMVSAPTIFAEAQRLRHAMLRGEDTSLIDKKDLMERFQEARAKFKQTFARFMAALKESKNAPTINISDDPVVGIDFEFSNTFVSSSYTGYWTVLCMINFCLQLLEQNNPDAFSMYHMENKESAMNICRTTKYMLTSSFLGPFFVIFGLRVALIVFEDGGRETEWILRKLFEIGDRHMSIAKHIPGFRPGSKIQELREMIERSRAGDLPEKPHQTGEGHPAFLSPGQHQHSMDRTAQKIPQDEIYS